jgi:predicted small lipoprotein YifL
MKCNWKLFRSVGALAAACAACGVAGCVYAPDAESVEVRAILLSSRLVVADGTNTVEQTIEGGAQGTATVPLK